MCASWKSCGSASKSAAVSPVRVLQGPGRRDRPAGRCAARVLQSPSDVTRSATRAISERASAAAWPAICFTWRVSSRSVCTSMPKKAKCAFTSETSTRASLVSCSRLCCRLHRLPVSAQFHCHLRNLGLDELRQVDQRELGLALQTPALRWPCNACGRPRGSGCAGMGTSTAPAGHLLEILPCVYSLSLCGRIHPLHLFVSGNLPDESSGCRRASASPARADAAAATAVAAAAAAHLEVMASSLVSPALDSLAPSLPVEAASRRHCHESNMCFA